jgi:hypothetical protein
VDKCAVRHVERLLRLPLRARRAGHGKLQAPDQARIAQPAGAGGLPGDDGRQDPDAGNHRGPQLRRVELAAQLHGDKAAHLGVDLGTAAVQRDTLGHPARPLRRAGDDPLQLRVLIGCEGARDAAVPDLHPLAGGLPVLPGALAVVLRAELPPELRNALIAGQRLRCRLGLRWRLLQPIRSPLLPVVPVNPAPVPD